MRAAGFTDVAFTDVREPVYYGPDVPAALDWVHGFTCARRSPGATGTRRRGERGKTAPRTLAAHLTDDGVWLASRSWLVTARHR